jgi:hypothetical protein
MSVIFHPLLPKIDWGISDGPLKIEDVTVSSPTHEGGSWSVKRDYNGYFETFSTYVLAAKKANSILSEIRRR